jgi:hypothetical protein
MGHPAKYPDQFRRGCARACAVVGQADRGRGSFARDRRGDVVELGPAVAWKCQAVVATVCQTHSGAIRSSPLLQV